MEITNESPGRPATAGDAAAEHEDSAGLFDPTERRTDAGGDAQSHAQLTFGQAIERLEKIADELERTDLDLDDALTRYEQGLALARACLERLDRAELRIKELTVSDK